MASIFNLENSDDFTEKLCLDDLYEHKQWQDQQEYSLYLKVLNKVHTRIKLSSKHSQICWFVVPEIILGVPKYNQANCIVFLMARLHENGFRVRYISPNTLMISWAHFVPTYIRNEYKRKTGIAINENGLLKEEVSKPVIKLDQLISQQPPPQKKKYNSISSYKPSGNI